MFGGSTPGGVTSRGVGNAGDGWGERSLPIANAVVGEPKRSLGHHPALDGFRGVGLILVLMGHSGDQLWKDAEPWLARGGVMGVHMFLVLSGFLITSLVLTEHNRTGHIDMGNFFMRRVRRLVPGIVALLVVLLIFSFVGHRLVARDVMASSVHVLSFSTNMWSIGDAPGIAQIVDWLGKPVPEVGHTWTLSNEAQFYALWVVTLWLAMKAKWSSARLFALAGAIVAVVAVVRFIRLQSDPDTMFVTLYFTTSSRLDAPIVGSMLGIAFCAGWLDRITPRVAAILAVVGFVPWFITAFTTDSLTSLILYRGLYTVTAFLCAAVIIGVVRAPQSAVPAFLAWRPFCFLGTISYSVYLFHFGMFDAADRNWSDWSGPARMAVMIPAALFVGWLSYKYVEAPFLKRRKQQPTPPVTPEVTVVAEAQADTTAADPAPAPAVP
jgi:peptidoglycan/LPS O-acetylase OafA/YrhL